MKNTPPAVSARRLAAYLAALFIAVFFTAVRSEAMLVPAVPEAQPAPQYDRAADLAKIQKVLESKALQQRLVDYGLSPEEARAKIDRLSDEQVHEFATRIDALQAGGMGGSSIIIILLLIIVILLLI